HRRQSCPLRDRSHQLHLRHPVIPSTAAPLPLPGSRYPQPFPPCRAYPLLPPPPPPLPPLRVLPPLLLRSFAHAPASLLPRRLVVPRLPAAAAAAAAASAAFQPSTRAPLAPPPRLRLLERLRRLPLLRPALATQTLKHHHRLTRASHFFRRWRRLQCPRRHRVRLSQRRQP
ncbi:unnamed protein product, partial [Ectocarpus sp. 6 AP-2014]